MKMTKVKEAEITMQITNDILYVGVNDHQVDLFEGQYDVPNGMAYNSYVIKDEIGLHARPAGLLVKEAKKFQSATTLAAKGKTAAAGKLIAIMSMGVKQGDEVTVQVEGPDEDAAFEAMEKFFQENL